MNRPFDFGLTDEKQPWLRGEDQKLVGTRLSERGSVCPMQDLLQKTDIPPLTMKICHEAR
jgi:hypothetical protein